MNEPIKKELWEVRGRPASKFEAPPHMYVAANSLAEAERIFLAKFPKVEIAEAKFIGSCVLEAK